MKKLLLILLCLTFIGFGQGPKFFYDKSGKELEKILKKYYDNNDLDPIEGIWYVTNHSIGGQFGAFKIAIVKVDSYYENDWDYTEYILENPGRTEFEGYFSGTLEKSSSEYVYLHTNKLPNPDRTTKLYLAESQIEYTHPDPLYFNGKKLKSEKQGTKIYPSTKPNTRNNTEWRGNGSGFFISKSGYIVTNNHVIDGASEIEVEFKYKNEVEGFNAKIVKVDKTNDLAIIKIDDSEFSNLSDIPYNFKTRSVDIGTEIFALGYPMALSLMGKDIKFTDGKISSKTGLGGDITTYQIQVPIQPGNSGGPLFDFKGNLIGITSSGVNRKLDITENVNYAIKSSYLLNLIDVLPETITLPSSNQLASKPLTEQIKILSDYVVLIKVK
jgi:S1-C subfamily serine protease